LKKKQPEITESKEFEFTYRYDPEDNQRDMTSDNWINTWKENDLGHTWGEMSPIQICEGQVKSEIKGIEYILKSAHGDPDWVLRNIAGNFDKLKNWLYLLHCATQDLSNRVPKTRV
jgi:hypothetical protein